MLRSEVLFVVGVFLEGLDDARVVEVLHQTHVLVQSLPLPIGIKRWLTWS